MVKVKNGAIFEFFVCIVYGVLNIVIMLLIQLSSYSQVSWIPYLLFPVKLSRQIKSSYMDIFASHKASTNSVLLFFTWCLITSCW